MERDSGKKRSLLIDQVKCMGIILVILGHAPGIPALLEKLIFAFHMPLFFFVSGFLSSGQKLTNRDFFAKYWKKLVRPYLLLSVMSYLFWFLVLRNFGADKAAEFSPFYPLRGIISGVAVDNMMIYNAPLWFLTCLFMVHFYSNCLQLYIRSKKIKIFAVLSALFTGHILLKYLPCRLPWNTELALTALLFFELGRLRPGFDFSRKNGWAKFIVILLSFSVLLGTVIYNGRVDMNTAHFNNLFLFYSGAFAGIILLFTLPVIESMKPLFIFISKETLSLLAFHGFAFSFITAFLVFVLKLSPADKSELWGAPFIYTFFSLIIILLPLPLIKKLLPSVFAQRK